MELASSTPANPQLDPQLVKTCTKCGETKPLGEFYADAHSKSGLQSWCKDCKLTDPAAPAYQIRSRAANPGRANKQSANWRRNNPEKRAAMEATRRARLALAPGNGVTPNQWLDVLADSLGICLYCGECAVLTMDHIDPLVSGGAHDVNNVVAVCATCNSSKGDTPLLVWLAKRANWRALVA